MSEWADANRQRWGRCHDCWNLDPCCVCGGKRQAQVDVVQFLDPPPMPRSFSDMVTQILWQGELRQVQVPRQARLSNIDDRADLSTLTADELEAMAYRAIYLDD